MSQGRPLGENQTQRTIQNRIAQRNFRQRKSSLFAQMQETIAQQELLINNLSLENLMLKQQLEMKFDLSFINGKPDDFKAEFPSPVVEDDVKFTPEQIFNVDDLLNIPSDTCPNSALDKVIDNQLCDLFKQKVACADLDQRKEILAQVLRVVENKQDE